MIETITQLASWLTEPRADAAEVAARLGGSSTGRLNQIDVRPRDPALAEVSIVARSDGGGVNHAAAVPALPVTLGQLREAFGPWTEGKRLHFDSPKKAHFEPRRGESYWAQLSAEVDANVVTLTDASVVQRVLVVRDVAPSTDSTAGQTENEPEEKVELWEPLRSGPVDFGVKTWRLMSLEDARDQAADAFGCDFVACDILGDGSPAFCASTPASRIRLNRWPAPDGSKRFVFHLVGEAAPGDAPRDISAQVASRLRSRGSDWYVPDPLEAQEAGGVLDDSSPEAIVAILAARWFAWNDDEARDNGRTLLREIVDGWLREARGDVGVLKKLRNEFESWGFGVPGDKRLPQMFEYYRDTKLMAIEYALGEIELTPKAQRQPQQLAEVRALVDEAAELIDSSPTALHAKTWRSINERLQKLS